MDWILVKYYKKHHKVISYKYTFYSISTGLLYKYGEYIERLIYSEEKLQKTLGQSADSSKEKTR